MLLKQILKKIKQIFPWPVFLIVFIFLFFGILDLTKFETTDEHFWKYDRIEKYWRGVNEGITEGKWKKTHINDKPGILVALLSGAGLPFLEEIGENRDEQKEKDVNNNYYFFNTERVEGINFALRFPILFANGLFIFYFYWVISRFIKKKEIVLIATALIGLSPILLGISQIMNPDALMWSTAAMALFSFIALLETMEKKFVWLTGACMGFALLSKYTSSLLFVFFPIIFLLFPFFSNGKVEFNHKYLKRNLFHLGIIWILAGITFSFLMPAAFEKPKFIWKGVINTPALSPIAIPFWVFIAFLIIDALFFKARFTEFVMNFIARYRSMILRMVSAFALLFVVFALVNAWSGGYFFSLDNLKESTYADRRILKFPMLKGHSALMTGIEKISIQSQSFIFSLPPVLLLTICIYWLIVIFNKIKSRYDYLILFFSFVPFVFYMGGLSSGIFVNARYSILLFPFYALFGAILFGVLYENYNERILNPFIKKYSLVITLVLIIVVSLWSLVTVRPHYFNYTSGLLPKYFVLHDSWSYGVYEAAEYLNSLPDAENLVVRSDRSAFCQYFVGKCWRNSKIDLSIVKPDYLLMTRRGILTNKFSWENRTDESNVRDEDYYYSEQVLNNPEWELCIGGRCKNFVKIVKVN